MPKKIRVTNLLGDISKANALDIIATVKAVATDLSSNLDRSSATYDVDRFVLEFLEQGIVLDDTAILMLKNFYDTARSTDLVTNKHVTKVLGETFILNEALSFGYGKVAIDTLLIPESLDFNISKALQEAPAANDTLAKFLDKARTELVSIADAKAVDFTKPRTDTAAAADTSVRNPNKQPSDTATIPEDPNFTVGKATSETARGTDAISLGPNKRPSDTARGTDADTAQFNKLAEFAIVRGTDVSTRQVNKQPSDTARSTDADPDFTIGKNPSDTARGTDADPDFTIGKNPSDTARGTDAVGKDVVRGTTADTSRATDTDTLTVGKNTTDTSSITDSAVRTIVKAVSDFISLSEGLSAFGAIDISFSNAEANISNIVDQFSRVVTYNRTFTETARGTDAVSKGPNKQPSDTARGTDADPDFVVGKNPSDTARGTDTSVREVGKNPSDTARGTDTSVRAVGKNPSDTASANEDPNFTVGKNPSDTARGTDTDVVDFEKFLGNLKVYSYPEQTLTDYTSPTVNAGEPLTVTSFDKNVIGRFGSDLFAWIQNFNGVVLSGPANSLPERDNTYAPSPAGGTPLRISVIPNQGGYVYYQTFNQQKFNLYPVISLNETWTASIYVYFTSGGTGFLEILGTNEFGGIVEGNSTIFGAGAGSWQRITVSRLFTNVNTKFVQVIFAGAMGGGVPFVASCHFDGLQVEKSSVATTYSDPNTTRATDLISQKQVDKTTTPDTARGTDTITQKQVAKTGITDTARGTDADPDLTVGKGLTDTARATDAFSRTLTWNRTFTDTARGTDTISNNPNKQPSDTARGTDSFSRVVAYSKSYADTARASDSFSRTVVYSKDYADTARGTDTIANRLYFYAGGDQAYTQTDFTGLDYNQEMDLLPTYRSDSLFNQYQINWTTFSNAILSAAVGVPAEVALFITPTINGRSLGDLSNSGGVTSLDAGWAQKIGAFPSDPLVIPGPDAQAYDWVMNYVFPYMVQNIGSYSAYLTLNGSTYTPTRKADITRASDAISLGPNKRPADTVAASESYIANVSDSINSLASGASGPTALGQISYAGIPSILSAPSVQTGYISFQVLVSGLYTFNITGAAGGVSTLIPPISAAAPTINGFKRAPGARVVGTVALTAGQVITMVVGQGGTDDTTVGNNSGGGGGTFVTLGNFASVVAGTDTLLFAAGGGGGGGQASTDNYSAGIGQAGTSGGSTSSGVAGTLGNGGQGNTGNNSTGGGGYFTSVSGGTAQSFGGAPADGISRGFRQGAVGSRNGGTAVGIGGFGGGGSGSSSPSTDNDKGGGGGYSGGGCAFDAETYAGGGGSYAIPSATAVTITAGDGTTYNGSVSISTTAVVNGFSRAVTYNRSGGNRPAVAYGSTPTVTSAGSLLSPYGILDETHKNQLGNTLYYADNNVIKTATLVSGGFDTFTLPSGRNITSIAVNPADNQVYSLSYNGTDTFLYRNASLVNLVSLAGNEPRRILFNKDVGVILLANGTTYLTSEYVPNSTFSINSNRTLPGGLSGGTMFCENNLFIYINNTTVYTSTDAVNWTLRTSLPSASAINPSVANRLYGGVYYNEVSNSYYIFGTNSANSSTRNIITTTTDFVTYTNLALPAYWTAYAVNYSASMNPATGGIILHEIGGNSEQGLGRQYRCISSSDGGLTWFTDRLSYWDNAGVGRNCTSIKQSRDSIYILVGLGSLNVVRFAGKVKTDTVSQVDTPLKRDHVQVGGETHFIQNDFTGSTEFVREYLDLIPDGGRTNSTPSPSATFLLGREIPNTNNNYLPFSKDMYRLIETDYNFTQITTTASRDLTTDLSPVEGIPLLLQGNFNTNGVVFAERTWNNTVSLNSRYGLMPYMSGNVSSTILPGFLLVPAGQQATFTVYAKADAAVTSGFLFNLSINDSQGTGSGQGFNTLNTNWQRFAVTYTNSSSAPRWVHPNLRVNSGGVSGGTKLWLDGGQLTISSNPVTFVSSSPNFPTLKMDRVRVGTARTLTISKAASGEARTKQTEFTPINYTQDLLQIIQPDL